VVETPAVVAPVAPAPVVEETPSETPTPTPTPTSAPSTAPAIIATPTDPPVMVKSEVQAAVAVATGSPLAVQAITVLVLLGLGFVYFRFISSKKATGLPRTRKS
jgi:hypothetical protein